MKFTRGAARSFYEDRRTRVDDADEEIGLDVDEANFRQNFDGYDPYELATAASRITVDSATNGYKYATGKGSVYLPGHRSIAPRWQQHNDEADDEVPASLLVEPKETDPSRQVMIDRTLRHPSSRSLMVLGTAHENSQANSTTSRLQGPPHEFEIDRPTVAVQGTPTMDRLISGGHRERALWRWVNTSNLDSFMRDVYDYYEGGGMWCVLCSNALWLL